MIQGVAHHLAMRLTLSVVTTLHVGGWLGDTFYTKSEDRIVMSIVLSVSPSEARVFILAIPAGTYPMCGRVLFWRPCL